MDPVDDLFQEARAHYLDQFRKSRDRFAAEDREVWPEVKFERSASAKSYRRLYCVDFTERKGPETGESGGSIVEVIPELRPVFPAFGFAMEAFYVRVSHLHWDRMNLTWSGPDLSDEAFDRWFRKWFDVDDLDYREGAEFQEKIHSAIKEPHSLSVDFGSAPVEALWALLTTLEKAGADVVHIFDETADPRDPPPPLGPS